MVSLPVSALSERAQTRHYLWEMRPYFRQTAGELVFGSICGIVMNTAVVLPAILLGRAIDAALALEQGRADPATVGWAVLAFVGGTLLTEVPRGFKRWWLMTANGRIRANLRADALRGVLAWSMERLHQTPVGDLMARVVGDVEVLGVGVREFTIESWDTVLFSISLVVAMFVFDAGLTALALAPVPLALTLAHATGRWVQRRTTLAREANADLTASLQEQLAGVRLLRLFGRAAAAGERTVALSRRQADANLTAARLRGALQPVYSALMTAGAVLLVWQGGERVIAGATTVGAFVGYLELYLRFINRGFRIPQMVNSIQSGAAAYARLRPLLAAPLTVRGEPAYASFHAGHVAGSERPVSTPPTLLGGSLAVSLEQVTFRYPGAAGLALQDISLEVPAGALVAVTGAVGSGKSALARTLLGLYPLAAGWVLLDGQPLDDLPAAERAARIGYLPQDGYVFSGSVRDNVLLDSPARDLGRSDGKRDKPFAERAVEQAVVWTALEQDLRGFPAGLDTQIGELGVRVSGGQRQRIALARALVASAPASPGLLVLDDPFSAVDVETESRILAGLRQAVGPLAPPERRATIVLCSHRLAAFSRADLVVVLDRGRIVERGTHDDLVRSGGLYARIYLAQRLAGWRAAAPETL
jgi:ATP-binding cassette, subfamily B, multidrug efflux pump